MDDVNRLKSWVASGFGEGSRPPSVVVPEFPERGVPHVHVVLFGVEVVPNPAVSHYWGAQRDVAKWCGSTG